jgi:hypothetical protein
LKYSWRSPFLADQQSISGSSVFAIAVAEQSLLSQDVPSAGLPNRSPANAPCQRFTQQPLRQSRVGFPLPWKLAARRLFETWLISP